MLVKITNRCSLGCKHCMENSVPKAPHMERHVFDAALKFIADVEGPAHALGYRMVLLSGGECSEHPEIVEFIRMVYRVGLVPLMITNGMWLADEELKAQILDTFPDLMIQVTNDPRFYPKAPPRVQDRRIIYEDRVGYLFQMGRFKKSEHPEVPMKKAPTSYNFRAFVHQTRDVRQAILALRARALSGAMNGHCSPSISHDGSFVAGESRLCANVGSVWLPAEVITEKILKMGECNICGLEKGLPPQLRKQIGLTPDAEAPGRGGGGNRIFRLHSATGNCILQSA